MLLSSLQDILPSWMTKAPRAHFGSLMAGVAGMLDAMGAAVQEGRLSAMPGQLDVPGGNGFDDITALPLTGRDRNIRGGISETIFSWADAQRRYKDLWAVSGTPYMLLEQVARVLGPTAPELVLVNGGGTWWVRSPGRVIFSQYTAGGTGFSYDTTDGTVSVLSTPAHAWEWDSLANPQPFGFGDVGRWWLIIRAPCDLPWLAAISGLIGDGRVIGTGGGGPSATTIGTTDLSQHVEMLRDIVLTWRSAGLRCSHIIIAFPSSPTSFMWDGTSADYPDGDYGWPCHVVGGVMVATRDQTARYWRAEAFGAAGTL